VLGLASLMPLLVAVPMGLALLSRHPVRLPRGFGWWLLFLLWVTLGLAVLFVDAPGAVPGGGAERVLVFGYRLAWYVACTVVLLWLGNADRSDVPDVLVHRLVGLLFVVAVAGGYLGLVQPTLEFRSAVEWLLPAGVRGNGFVSSLVHPETADVQQVLGRPETRPKAPFAFTNTWGSVLSLTLVFFVAALRTGSRRLRLLGAAVSVAAAVPVVYSLNRGLWAALALGVVGVVLLNVLKGRPWAVVGLATAATLGAVVLLASPLGELYGERLDNQHSNERRSQLLAQTVASVNEGSPVVGFGSTRDVQGTFASISGGATPDCPACGVPPLGTQGHLWLVLFSQGWPGLAFFLVFVLLALSRSWRCRTLNETVCTFAIGFFLLQLAVYDTLGLPLMVVMVSIALVWREQHAEAPHVHPGTTARLARRMRHGLPVIVGLAALGASTGWFLDARGDRPSYSSSVSMVIVPAPVYLGTGPVSVPGEGGFQLREPREITLDTEAAMLLSQGALTRAARATDLSAAGLRSAITVTASPNSRVLQVTVRDATPEGAERAASTVARSYLAAREDHLRQRREHLLAELHEELRRLPRTDPSTFEARVRYVTAAIDHLDFSDPTAGYVFREDAAKRVRPQHEVPAVSGLGLGTLVGLGAAAGRRTLRRGR
jgi:hypothetical protein